MIGCWRRTDNFQIEMGRIQFYKKKQCNVECSLQYFHKEMCDWQYWWNSGENHSHVYIKLLQRACLNYGVGVLCSMVLFLTHLTLGAWLNWALGPFQPGYLGLFCTSTRMLGNKSNRQSSQWTPSQWGAHLPWTQMENKRRRTGCIHPPATLILHCWKFVGAFSHFWRKKF